MKKTLRTLFPLTVFSLLLLACSSLNSQPAGPNQLTASEKKAGWTLLFDGKSLTGWRIFGKPDAPQQGWVVENGCLRLVPKSNPGNLVTVEQFSDYDLRWEWRVGTKGNNGIKYLVTESRPSAPGPEYQMVDDAGMNEPPKRSTASFYDVLPPREDKPLKSPGEWNHSRILIKGNRVEHWLNGKKVLKYELESPELEKAIAQSKFKTTPGFGKKIKGHIMLTDHHDEVFYRNIKILELTSK